MCSSSLQLAPGSRDLSQAEKIITVIEREQIKKKMLKIVLDKQSCHFVNLLSLQAN